MAAVSRGKAHLRWVLLWCVSLLHRAGLSAFVAHSNRVLPLRSALVAATSFRLAFLRRGLKACFAHWRFVYLAGA